MSSKIDTVDPHGGEPLAILLASIVARVSSQDFARLDAFLSPDKTSGDIARHAQRAIAGVPPVVASGGSRAGRIAGLRRFLVVTLAAALPRLRLRALAMPAGIKLGGGLALAALALTLVLVHVSGRVGRLLPVSDLAAPSPRTQAATVQLTEERPIGGTGVEFTQANLRYCTFQQIRLEALGPITEGADLVVFNALVQDWNSRCTKFRYRLEDKETVDTEAASRRALLEVEGRALMNGWRRKIVTTVQQRPAGLDIGEPAATTPQTVAKPEPSNEIERLPLLITLGRSAAEEADRESGLSLRTPSLALLRVDVAMRVQRRLNDLGYTIAPVDGTWGTASRNALRRFKQANDLLGNDAFDAETVTRLFSTAAITAARAGGGDDQTAAIETAYPPPPAAGMNPLNRAEGQRIQQRLADLGYYSGRGEGAWGSASRAALRSFKAANGLRDTDEWDAMAETILFDEQAVRAADAPAIAPRNPVTSAATPAVPLPPKRPPAPAAKTVESTPALAPREAPRPPAVVPATGPRVSGTATRGSP